MSVVLQKNCEYFLLEICKPLQCKASEAKISGLKPPDIGNTQDREVLGVFLCPGGVARPIAEAADRGSRAGSRRREKPRLQAVERRVTIGKMK